MYKTRQSRHPIYVLDKYKRETESERKGKQTNVIQYITWFCILCAQVINSIIDISIIGIWMLHYTLQSGLVTLFIYIITLSIYKSSELKCTLDILCKF